jgi:hypothetical protein
MDCRVSHFSLMYMLHLGAAPHLGLLLLVHVGEIFACLTFTQYLSDAVKHAISATQI